MMCPSLTSLFVLCSVRTTNALGNIVMDIAEGRKHGDPNRVKSRHEEGKVRREDQLSRALNHLVALLSGNMWCALVGLRMEASES